MTVGTGQEAVPAAESIEDFEDLYPRRVGLDSYTVLSLSEDGFTAYEVALDGLECSCADYRYSRDGPDICKHIAATLYQQPEIPGLDEAVVSDLADDVAALRDEVGHAVQRSADAQAEAAQAAAQPPEEKGSSGTGTTIEDPVGRFNALLRDAGLPPESFEVFVHDSLGSLQVSKDGYLEGEEFSTWTELSDDLGLGYDGDDDVNYLPEEDWSEVLG